MVVEKVFLVERIFLHLFVVFEVLDHDLTKAIVIGEIGQLPVVKLCRELTCLSRIVDLRSRV